MMYDQMQDFVNDPEYDTGISSLPINFGNETPKPVVSGGLLSQAGAGEATEQPQPQPQGQATPDPYSVSMSDPSMKDLQPAAVLQADSPEFRSALAKALLGYTNPAATEAGLGGWIKDIVKTGKEFFKDNPAGVTLAGSFLKGLFDYPNQKRAADILQQRANNETRQTDILAQREANKSSMSKVKYKPGKHQFVDVRSQTLGG